MEENNKKYPEGYFVGMWMAIGTAVFSALGISLAMITENPGMIGIGPAVGVAIGLSIGSGIEAKYKKEGKIRPLKDGNNIRHHFFSSAFFDWSFVFSVTYLTPNRF
jgi:hypothetical protein